MSSIKKTLVSFVGMGLLAVSLFAGPDTRLILHIPFGFHAAGKLLPAGNYSFLEEPDTGLVMIRGEAADSSVALLTTPGTRVPAGAERGAKFEKVDGETYLTGVVLDDTVRLVGRRTP